MYFDIIAVFTTKQAKNAMDELTPSQQKWADELTKVLNRMPRGLEMCVQLGGFIGIAAEGTLQASSDRHGHCDYDDVQWLETLDVKPSVARRIDGRDSQL